MPPGNTEIRKLAAIVFTDMVGYSALSHQNEALALELVQESQTILREQFSAFNGREVKSTGDGFLVEFPNALHATQCAVEIQRKLAERNQREPEARRIFIRIGIHLGDVVVRETDVFGDGVNIAARIEPLAVGGGICISDAVYAQVRNKINLQATKIEAPELKNIRTRVDVYRINLPWDAPSASVRKAADKKAKPILIAASVCIAIVLISGFWMAKRPSLNGLKNQRAPITSIAVKPLDDFSREASQSYLSDGMTEALCTALGNISALRVPGRSTVMRYKGGQKSIPEMAKELGVDAIVEGSVQRATNRILITVQLVDGSTDRHLWATNYERDLSDFFKIQNEVAQAIAAEVKVRISPEDSRRLAQVPTANSEVIDEYLQGRFHITRGTKEGFEQALARFQKVVQIDPHFAKGYSGIADAYSLAMGWYIDDELGLAEGFKAAKKAAELEPESAETLTSIGSFYQMMWRWADATKAFKRALELNPRYAPAHLSLGFDNLLHGQSELVLPELIRAHESDPNAFSAANIGICATYLGRFDVASNYFDKALSLDPNLWFAHSAKAVLLGVTGNNAEAVQLMEKAVASSPGNTDALSSLAWIYGKNGNREKAGEIIRRLTTMKAPRRAAPYHFAVAYLGLGNMDDVFKAINEGVRAKDPGMVYLLLDTRFKTLQGDPRFDKIRRDMGLVE